MRDLPMAERTQRIVTEIFEFAIRNNAVPTQSEITGEHPTFFVWYSGHTTGLTVSIAPKGWKANERDEHYDIDLSPDEYTTAEAIEARLLTILARMAEVMNEWEAKQHE